MRFLVCILLLVVSASAADLQALMQQGNDHYQNGHFQEAIGSYQRILAEGYESGALHYNLANAYFKINEVGWSILHYQKAQRLLPRDSEVEYNLKHARLYRRDRFELPEPMPVVQLFMKIRESRTLSELRRLVMICWILLVILFLVYRSLRLRGQGNSFLYALIPLGIIFMVLGGWLLDRSLHAEEEGVVVLEPVLEAHSAPLESSDILFVVHEGTEGRIEQETDDWYEIRLPDGKSGWVPQNALGLF